MVNLKVLAEARNKFSPQEILFLLEQQEQLFAQKPYKGLKILHNVPLTLSTVIKIENLILGGADVTVAFTQSVPPQVSALGLLSRANVKILNNYQVDSDYDLYLDCCGELANTKAPRLGTIELTQTGSQIYKELRLPYPVVSIDDCILKHLEAIGTGDGFVRALRKITGKSLRNKKFIVFGYGKIGKGIIKALLNHTSNIIVIEKNPILLEELKFHGLQGILMTEKGMILNHLKNTFCVVTSTGVRNCISSYFDESDFTGIYLANMGAEDEFGYKFSAKNVLFEKRPINFVNTVPTAARYLDPVFFAHNAAINLFLSGNVADGYQAFPESFAKMIIEKWSNIHGEEIDSFIKSLKNNNGIFNEKEKGYAA